MFLYVVIAFRNGYDGSQGEVIGHYRCLKDAIARGVAETACEEMAVFNVYKCVY